MVEYTSILRERGAEYSDLSGLEKTLKKVEKTFEKVLTNEKGCGIITRSPRKGGGEMILEN